jgi:hypothetical protein
MSEISTRTHTHIDTHRKRCGPASSVIWSFHLFDRSLGPGYRRIGGDKSFGVEDEVNDGESRESDNPRCGDFPLKNNLSRSWPTYIHPSLLVR